MKLTNNPKVLCGLAAGKLVFQFKDSSFLPISGSYTVPKTVVFGRSPCPTSDQSLRLGKNPRQNQSSFDRFLPVVLRNWAETGVRDKAGARCIRSNDCFLFLGEWKWSVSHFAGSVATNLRPRVIHRFNSSSVSMPGGSTRTNPRGLRPPDIFIGRT